MEPKRAGFIPILPIHLWSYCFKDRYDKERIIQTGARLIELCNCFYFCDCKYDEDMHIEMKLWHDRAKALNKRFISIDRKFVRCLPSKGDILQEPSKLLKKYPLIGN